MSTTTTRASATTKGRKTTTKATKDQAKARALVRQAEDLSSKVADTLRRLEKQAERLSDRLDKTAGRLYGADGLKGERATLAILKALGLSFGTKRSAKAPPKTFDRSATAWDTTFTNPFASGQGTSVGKRADVMAGKNGGSRVFLFPDGQAPVCFDVPVPPGQPEKAAEQAWNLLKAKREADAKTRARGS